MSVVAIWPDTKYLTTYYSSYSSGGLLCVVAKKLQVECVLGTHSSRQHVEIYAPNSQPLNQRRTPEIDLANSAAMVLIGILNLSCSKSNR